MKVESSSNYVYLTTQPPAEQTGNQQEGKPAPAPAKQPAGTKHGSEAPKPQSQNIPQGSHRVSEGETLYSIANKNHKTVAELRRLNPDLKTDKNGNPIIVPGSIIKVSETSAPKTGKESNSSESGKKTPASSNKAGTQTYKVKNGDVLSVIAQKYGIPTLAIMLKNNITDPQKIRPEQTLIIPTKAEAAQLVSKQKEMSAKKTVPSTQNKSTANNTKKTPPKTTNAQSNKNTTNNKQKTTIPKGKIADKMGIIEYKIKQGDTLAGISKAYGIPIKDLLAYNSNLKGVEASSKLSEKKIKKINIIGTKKAVMDATGVSQIFIDDLIAMEKKRNTLYTDAAGIPTIGIGHNTKAHGDTKQYEGWAISDNQVYSLLARDIKEAQNTIKKCIGKDAFDKLSLGQKEALYGLIFNTGGLSNSPKLIAALKSGKYTEAACQMDQVCGTINGEQKVLPGLAKRRLMDISKFISGSHFNEKQIKIVTQKLQKIYDAGYDSIQNQNTKIDYNAHAKKYMGKYITQGYIKLKA